jgi:glycosyltransferase involved in cell wall biosynthesis
MLGVADLRALLPRGTRDVPIVCYFHENQLTYPLPAGQVRDFQYGVTNITSCLTADAVLFNSKSHLNEFLEAARALLQKMPDFVPAGVVEEIAAKAKICPPPLSFEPTKRAVKPPGAPPTILWCHRWEEDKNPAPFFAAIAEMDRLGLAFDLVLIGEQFRTAPPVFSSFSDALSHRIRYAAFIDSPEEYRSMLATCDIVVSTANQETFGLAILEAILAGCRPLLPDRLSYPEVVPREFHDRCLYPSDSHLSQWLRNALDRVDSWSPDDAERLSSLIQAQYGLSVGIRRLDDAIEVAC